MRAALRIKTVNGLRRRVLGSNLRPESVGFLAVRNGLSGTSFGLVHSCVPGLISISVSEAGTATVPSFAFSRGGCLLEVGLPRGLGSVKRHMFDGYKHLYNALRLPTDIATVRFNTFVKYSGLHCMLTAKGGVAALNSGLFKSKIPDGLVCGGWMGRWP